MTGPAGRATPGVTAPTTFSCTTTWALVMAWTTQTAHPRRRKKTGSGAKVNFALSTPSVPTGKARVVETNSGRVSNAPSKGGEGNSSLRSRTGGGIRSGNDSANNAVGSGNEFAPTSPSTQDGGESTGGGGKGETAPPSHAPSYSASTSDSGEGVAQSVRSRRDRPNLGWMEGLLELTAGRTRGETRVGALLAKLESVREEMYAFNVDNASSPGEVEFGFRSPIGLHVGQAESIPPNWADLQKSEF